MSLVCQFIGHRRSRSRATFDDKRQQWVSCCKRCAAVLVREADGRWAPIPAVPDKLVPVERDAQPGDLRIADGQGPRMDAADPYPVAELERIMR